MATSPTRMAFQPVANPRPMLCVCTLHPAPIQDPHLHNGSHAYLAWPTKFWHLHEKEDAIRACWDGSIVVLYDVPSGRDMRDIRGLTIIHPPDHVVCDCCRSVVDSSTVSKCRNCQDSICLLCKAKLLLTAKGRVIELPSEKSLSSVICCICLEKLTKNKTPTSPQPAALPLIPIVATSPRTVVAASQNEVDGRDHEVDLSASVLEAMRNRTMVATSEQQTENLPQAAINAAATLRNYSVNSGIIDTSPNVSPPHSSPPAAELDIDSVVSPSSRKRKDLPVVTRNSSRTDKEGSDVEDAFTFYFSEEDEEKSNFATATKRRKAIEDEDEEEDGSNSDIPSTPSLLVVRDAAKSKYNGAEIMARRMIKNTSVVSSSLPDPCIMWTLSANRMDFHGSRYRATDLAYDLFTGPLDLAKESTVYTCIHPNAYSRTLCIQPKHQKKMSKAQAQTYINAHNADRRYNLVVNSGSVTDIEVA